jgi:hypothetical protein
MSTRDEFTQGESFGRHAERQDLLPLLKAVYFVLRGYAPRADVTGRMLSLVSDIECPPVTPKPTTPTDDESIPF